MLVQPPNTWDAQPFEFAEWLELLSIVRWPNPSGEGELRSFLEGVADDLGLFSNTDEFNDAVEAKIQAVFEEFSNRQKWSGAGYPFSIEKSAVTFTAQGTVDQLSDHILGYLFGLLTTFYRHTYFPQLPKPKRRRDLFPQHDKLEDLFQVCGTIAAAGVIEGHSISFGFPRTGDVKFYDKLLAVGKELADGKPKTGWEPGSSPNPKDAGVDIIAWRPCPDRLPGQLYMLGQCASGDNWEPGKLPIIDHAFFHEDYWSLEPHSPLITATFIPFDFRTGIADVFHCPLEEAWVNERWRLTRSHGMIIDRFRLAHYFATGLKVGGGNTWKVEAIDQIAGLKLWIVDALEFVRK
jgi:hypothetical protein